MNHPLFFWIKDKKDYVDLEVTKLGMEKKFYDLCAPVVQEQGLVLYDLEYIAGSKLLRIYVLDEKTGSALINDCVKIDHALTPYFEKEEWVPEHLVLEVSSPGLFRALKTKEHFERVIGKEIALVLSQPLEIHGEKSKQWKGQKKITGILKNIFSDGLVLDLGEEYQVDFSAIKRASLNQQA